MKRCGISGVLFVVLLSLSTTTLAAQSHWVYPGPNGNLVYLTTSAGDRIMDFSYAGYMGGGVALPDVPVVLTVKPSGKADDIDTIQDALDRAGKLPFKNGFRGAVLLAPGTFSCSRTIVVYANGVVLRGSGSGMDPGPVTTIKLIGRIHLGISIRPFNRGGRRGIADDQADASRGGTWISDAYVPAGASQFHVASSTGLAVGDTISIRRPVTAAWVHFMGMDDMSRDGRPQTWIRSGTAISIIRKIAAISGHRITLDVPLADSFDARYLNPPGTAVVKITPPAMVSQCGVENLHILSPPQAINHDAPHFEALRVFGEDCWARNILADETMNSVSVGGRRITLERISVRRVALHQGASKPAEFAPDGDQVLLDRCSVSADNVWFSATGEEHEGPIVLLNCLFRGNSDAESHQRWSTGILYDNCAAPEGGITLRNRGSMGSGHGWTMGWGVIWNCQAKDYIVQTPPGALNWLIGSLGEPTLAPRPFGRGPNMPEGVVDSLGSPVAPKSLYLTQLLQRLGPQALKNIGYSSDTDLEFPDQIPLPPGSRPRQHAPVPESEPVEDN
jgi:hypothetical protein